jgi:hypothetical protein
VLISTYSLLVIKPGSHEAEMDFSIYPVDVLPDSVATR